jgi:hypothetical protein
MLGRTYDAAFPKENPQGIIFSYRQKAEDIGKICMVVMRLLNMPHSVIMPDGYKTAKHGKYGIHAWMQAMPWPMVAILAGMLGLGMQLYRNVKSRWSITASSAPADPRLHAEYYKLSYCSAKK